MSDVERGAGPAPEVVRSEEHLVGGVESRASGTVRVGKRVVTEERTVTVTVRREELYVERTDEVGDWAPGTSSAGARDDAGPVLTLTLSEEEPVVSTRVVPRETVRFHVDRVTSDVRVDDEVAREVVELDVDDAGAR